MVRSDSNIAGLQECLGPALVRAADCVAGSFSLERALEPRAKRGY